MEHIALGGQPSWAIVNDRGIKDLGLAGAALMLVALFAHVESDLGLTITGPLFDL